MMETSNNGNREVYEIEVQVGGGIPISQFSDLANGLAGLTPGQYRVVAMPEKGGGESRKEPENHAREEGRPKVVRIIDGTKIGHWDREIRIFDRRVKQTFQCQSCDERTCTIEIEDGEEIKRLPKLPCLYCGEEVAEVNFKRLGPDPASIEVAILKCDCRAGRRTGYKICEECSEEGDKHEADPEFLTTDELRRIRQALIVAEGVQAVGRAEDQRAMRRSLPKARTETNTSWTSWRRRTFPPIGCG